MIYPLIRTFTRLALLVALGVLTIFTHCSASYPPTFNMSDEVKQQLTSDYIEYQLINGVEFCFCLYGTENLNETIVVERYLPPQRGTATTVNWQGCPIVRNGLHYVAYGHSHPPDHPNSLTPSQVDLDTFAGQNVRHTIIIAAVKGEMMVTLLSKR